MVPRRTWRSRTTTPAETSSANHRIWHINQRGQNASNGYPRGPPCSPRPFHGRHHALTTAALLRSFFSLPLVTFKIVAAIHWEALRLWLKGARLAPRASAAPANTAFNTGLAIRKHADYTGTTLSAAGREPGSRESALVQ